MSRRTGMTRFPTPVYGRPYSVWVEPRIKTIISLAGLAEGDAREGVPGLLRGLRREPRVAAADAAWDAGGSCLVVTVEAFVDGEATDADEAENFHRVWRCAVRCFGGAPAVLRFDIDGSVGLAGDAARAVFAQRGL